MKPAEAEQVRKELSSELYQGETVFFLSTMEGANAVAGDDSGAGLCVVATTARRILILFQVGIFSKRFVSHSIKWDDFEKVEFSSALGKGSLFINGGAILIVGRVVELSEVHRQINKTAIQISEAPQQAPVVEQVSLTQPMQSSSSPDITDKLAKLAELYRTGVLTDQEFTDAKRRLINP